MMRNKMRVESGNVSDGIITIVYSENKKEISIRIFISLSTLKEKVKFLALKLADFTVQIEKKKYFRN